MQFRSNQTGRTVVFSAPLYTIKDVTANDAGKLTIEESNNESRLQFSLEGRIS